MKTDPEFKASFDRGWMRNPFNCKPRPKLPIPATRAVASRAASIFEKSKISQTVIAPMPAPTVEAAKPARERRERKIPLLRVVLINRSILFVVAKKTMSGAPKTFADIRREYERYEDGAVDSIEAAAFTDKYYGEKRIIADVIEQKEFEQDDLPFTI